jgi:uncharacterized protein YndB with AHSA1/START domain
MDDASVSVERVIPAPPQAIFALLADASQHSRIDGSGTVKESKGRSQPLGLGSTFGMSMRLGIPYSTVNEVVEFEPDRRIAWRPKLAGPIGRIPLGGRVWRYELEPVEGGTRVRETWDVSADNLKRLFVLARLPDQTRTNMEKTLERIEAIVTGKA